MDKPIYLDYNATTPLLPEVWEAMLPYLQTHFGNPSSGHVYGQAARKGVDIARQQVAALIGAQPDEIYFTSGGTEANNLAIFGLTQNFVHPGGLSVPLGAGRVPRRSSPLLIRGSQPSTTPMAFSGRRRRVGLRNVSCPGHPSATRPPFALIPSGALASGHLITSPIEHPATLKPVDVLAARGWRVTFLPVDGHGQVILDGPLPPHHLLTVMHANNETGTIQPIRALADAAHAQGAYVHTDAAQSVGKVPVRVDDLGVDLLSIAGHKLYAPKGVGALYCRRGTPLTPFLRGAGHELGIRPGTENVASIVGLGVACERAEPPSPALRDYFWDILAAAIKGLQLNGHPQNRLPNTLNLRFPGVSGAALLAQTPEIAASTGSACHDGHEQASAVILAMGVPENEALGSVRLTLGRYTTRAQVETAAAALIGAWRSRAV